MCGRYVLLTLADFTDMFPWIRGPEDDPEPRYNIAPTQPIPIVTNDGKNAVELAHWGLIPFWAKDPSIGNKMINARVETLAEKPAFRAAFQKRRCIVPASGFYEWKKNPDGKTKTPMYIHRKDGRTMVFAGLWESWKSPEGKDVRSCTLITGKPNELVATIHDRMVVMLPISRVEAWLDPKPRQADELLPMLTPIGSDELEAHAVSRAVNSPRNDSPSNIVPADNSAPPENVSAAKKKSKKNPTSDDSEGLFG